MLQELEHQSQAQPSQQDGPTLATPALKLHPSSSTMSNGSGPSLTPEPPSQVCAVTGSTIWGAGSDPHDPPPCVNCHGKLPLQLMPEME